MKVREYFTDETRWVQGQAAVDRDGVPVKNLDSPLVARRCLYDAIRWCYRLDKYEFGRIVLLTINALVQESSGRITVWNDAPERTFAEVRMLVERLDI